MPSYNSGARINAVASACPSHDVEATYRRWAEEILTDERDAKLFARMAERSGIEHRWSVLGKAADLTPGGFYTSGVSPTTAQRMAIYAREAPPLALEAIRKLPDFEGITHLVVASCTGFTAPGIDQIIARELGLPGNVERTLIGFMGCYAGATALRTAGHLANANPGAKVLVVTVELCSLHLQAKANLEATLAMAQFSDGAAAAIVSCEGPGLAIGEGLSATIEESSDLITWTIGDTGFLMNLSGEVPRRLSQAMADPALAGRIVNGGSAAEIDAWAVHPGGASILDAVERAFHLPETALAESRAVLRNCGNMSSAAVMFVLERIMRRKPERGVALAFGPGLAMEGFRFGWTDGDAV
ncbi:type III polyketide synthase [Altererythrobacter salegens]|uniref:Type III polyketide synthase n=1 Tax=Croceibacterium salegens TaxID=1737568 RepID=A0A6I4STJ1_9SPHN|nr:type III polyketide synthase [Croceibacterium salegens]MXO59183.1 type III polyketide synthase [Croceibacterium salegens]